MGGVCAAASLRMVSTFSFSLQMPNGPLTIQFSLSKRDCSRCKLILLWLVTCIIFVSTIVCFENCSHYLIFQRFNLDDTSACWVGLAAARVGV